MFICGHICFCNILFEHFRCPRYLHVTSEMLTGEDENVMGRVSGGAPPQATLAKCSPPIRNRHNQRMLVEGLEEGAITSMSTMSLMFDVRQKMMHTNDLIRSVSGTDGLET